MARYHEGPVQREGNLYYLGFLDYIYEKNQESAIPAPREVVYNIAEQVWHELEIRFEKDGLEAVYEKMRAQHRNTQF